MWIIDGGDEENENDEPIDAFKEQQDHLPSSKGMVAFGYRILPARDSAAGRQAAQRSSPPKKSPPQEAKVFTYSEKGGARPLAYRDSNKGDNTKKSMLLPPPPSKLQQQRVEAVGVQAKSSSASDLASNSRLEGKDEVSLIETHDGGVNESDWSAASPPRMPPAPPPLPPPPAIMAGWREAPSSQQPSPRPSNHQLATIDCK
jgi:hypothetical protein